MLDDDYAPCDLDELHDLPDLVRLTLPDGRVVRTDLPPRTRREWCAQLALWYGDWRDVPAESVERMGLTREQFATAAMDYHQANAQLAQLREDELWLLEVSEESDG